MRNIFKNISYQLRLSYLSKHFYILFICSISIIALYSFSQFKQLDQNIETYKKDAIVFEKSGISEEEALLLEDEKQEIKSENGDILTIEQNPLKSSSRAITMTLYSISPYYFLQNILEGATYLFFPIVLSIYAIFISAQEYENKIIRIRAIKNNWGKVMVSKMMYLLIVGIIFILFTSLLSYLVASLQYKLVDDNIVNKFMTNEYMVSFNIIQNIGISILVSAVFISLSVLLTTLFKKRFEPLIIILIYLLVIPSLGVYDLKNVLMNLTLHYFPYYGTSSLSNVKELPNILCLVYPLVLMLIVTTLIYIVSKRQNKYV